VVLTVSAPGVTVTLTVFDAQAAASVNVIVAVAGTTPPLLPLTGVTANVAVFDDVVCEGVTVATVVSLDEAVTAMFGPGSVTVIFCVAVVPLKESVAGLTPIGPFTWTGCDPVSGPFERLMVAEPGPAPCTVNVAGLDALVGDIVATLVLLLAASI
jgi:hypothetical protein